MDDTRTMHAMGIDDAYHVEQVLARGPRGVTELVTIDGVGPFVRKKIPTVLAQRGVWSALGGSTCPRLPRVEATYELPDCVAVVLDYIPGPTLEQVVAERGRLQQNEAVSLAQQICEAVQELHRLGVLHRDLTPANIIVADDGAHIIDLGIARPLTDTANRNRDTTALGTYGFASPEQYGFAPTDVRSDIYSLGCILGFMLTGVYPDDTRYTPLLSDDLCVTPRLRAIVERATAFEPSARYQNVAQFAQALTSPTDPADSYVPAYAVQRPAVNGKPRPRTVIAVAVACVAVVAIVAAAVLIPRWIANADSDGDATSGTSQNAGSQPDPSTGNDGDAADPGTDPATRNPAGDGAAHGGSEYGNPLELVETGWSADESGYVHYAFGLRNTSDSVCIQLPSVEITGRGEDGSVLFSETLIMANAFAGETVYFGSEIGNGNGIVPATVDFTVLEPDDYSYVSSSESASFKADNLSAAPDGYGGEIFSGEISVVKDSARVREQSSMLAVSLVLRDDAGAIVYGYSTFVDWPSEGGSRPFSMDVIDPPAYDSFEVHVQPW
ncbi:Serine/threonine protein kinase [Bifidobacterium pullorum subsp. saeculare DSM 6531 = LMG 14934]|uniref:non-specific serine/threonine protein kinase n=1 Tax=Bifidobacterium pullorum subsp. saeculare DSM 6531 = LMG 14934 TaxID=1437611 RepID=A0A087CS52_9BIFI|nr:serine/threonine-protein kinase [Bifidobacterium pullorum]KFI86102.1 Serine/threonine protein kinase [Bifidobacterium pullorum subsp. saeculare DSM 6531 = LMG 14934]